MAAAIVALLADPAARDALGREARATGAEYDIGRFVQKMERLYLLMHAVSRATHREGVAQADLSFLTRGGHPGAG